MTKMYVNTDGGSRGNPGPAAIGIAFFDAEGKQLFTHKECIGKATNNEAEYSAIVKALKILLKSQWFGDNNDDAKEVICRLDSKLVVEQICGNYKIKQDHLRVFVNEIHSIIAEIKLKLSFVHIPREENKVADKLVNQALDEECKE